MVQTRSQTREGAPAPPGLWSQAEIRPGRRRPVRRLPPPRSPLRPPPPPPPRLTLFNILTVRDATEPCLPIVASLYQFLNAVDVDIFLQAIPSLRAPLQNPHVPLPSFRCQDCPPLPCVKITDPASPWHLMMAAREGPGPPCEIPGHHMTQHKKCEGHGLGYTFHSENFWICMYCVRRAWDMYSMTSRPLCYDMCLACSQAYRASNPVAALNECSCESEREGLQLYLCSRCRQARGREEHGQDCDRLAGYNSNMDPIHGPLLGGALVFTRQRDRVAHFIDPAGPFGESTCICGRDVTQKIDSYLVGPPPFTWHDFAELVRICSHCHKQKYLYNPYPY
jgi:hypothetical protein